MIIINQPVLSLDNDNFKYSSEIDFINVKKELYFYVEKSFKEFLTNLSDPLLIALLIPCMNHSHDMLIRGKVSKQLYDNLEEIQNILKIVIPGLEKINVEVTELVENNTKESKTNVLAGFSAGIDSFVTYDDYFLNPKENLKITHLLFNNLIYDSNRLQNKLDNIDKFMKYVKLPLIKNWTNLHWFYQKANQNIGFEQTHTMRNAAISHFLGGIANTFLYSSTYHKDLISIKESKDLAIVDDILLPLLSSYTVTCKAVGSEYTRLEKTIKISDMPLASDYLDTCINKHKDDTFLNCGVCRKCTRALLTFETVNKKEKFKNVFDLSKWHTVKNQYLSDLPTRTQLNDVELYEYLLKINYFNMEN